jgi:hypothetical protein
MNRRATFVLFGAALLAAVAALLGAGRWAWRTLVRLHGGGREH